MMISILQECTDPFAFIKSLYRKIDCRLCDTITTTCVYHLAVFEECGEDTADKGLVKTRGEGLTD